MRVFPTTALPVVVSVSLAVVFPVWTPSFSAINVNAFSFAPLPLSTTISSLTSSKSSATKSQSRRRSSSSSSALFLADEIKEYRKGLSQIHKNHPSDDDSDTSTRRRVVDCVFKFGGSSLANAERIDHVAHLIQDQIALNYRPRAVVCSAMGKTTNNLLSAGEFALGE